MGTIALHSDGICREMSNSRAVMPFDIGLASMDDVYGVLVELFSGRFSQLFR